MEYLLSQYSEPDFCVRSFVFCVVDLVVDLTLTTSVGNF